MIEMRGTAYKAIKAGVRSRGSGGKEYLGCHPGARTRHPDARPSRRTWCFFPEEKTQGASTRSHFALLNSRSLSMTSLETINAGCCPRDSSGLKAPQNDSDRFTDP